MHGSRRVLLALSLIVFQASFARAQQSPWTGIAADEARPAVPGGGFANPEMMPRSMSGDGRFVVFYSTVLNAGTHQLSATFTPADSVNYAGATTAVPITVAKAAPVLSWVNPAGVTYGTALSATQLNATTNVAGSFVYSPAAGSALGAGTQNLSVSFTPADSANYTSAGRRHRSRSHAPR